MTNLGGLCLELLSGKGLESAFLEEIGHGSLPIFAGHKIRGGWGRCPTASDAPRSEASALGASLAVASSTPATPLLSPAKIRELNHAGNWPKT